MRESSIARCGAALAAVWILCSVTTLSAQSPDQPRSEPDPAAGVSGDVVPVVGPRSTLEVAERFSKVLEFKSPIARVDGFDPAVLAVTPLSQTQLRLQALDQGVTTIVFTDAEDTPIRWRSSLSATPGCCNRCSSGIFPARR
uniref:Pilus formation protein N-terminal domain-containing protein n=1 Tax=Schlesneria paludicola TaxID=360056 RepID=A0A7C2NXE8_9PLAN